MYLMFSKLTILLQGVFFLIISTGSDYARASEIFVSGSIFEKNCLLPGQLCDGSSPEKATQNFFSAMTLAYDQCTRLKNAGIDQPLQVDIIFLDESQDAGNSPYTANINLTSYCLSFNMTLRSDKKLSVLRFSKLNFQVTVPFCLKLSRVRFELISFDFDYFGSLFLTENENSTLFIEQSEFSLSTNRTDFGIVKSTGKSSFIRFENCFFQVSPVNFIFKADDSCATFSNGNSQGSLVFSGNLIIVDVLNSNQLGKPLQFYFALTNFDFMIYNNTIKGFAYFLRVCKYCYGSLSSLFIAAIEIDRPGSSIHIRIDDYNKVIFKNIHLENKLAPKETDGQNSEIFLINSNNYVVFDDFYMIDNSVFLAKKGEFTFLNAFEANCISLKNFILTNVFTSASNLNFIKLSKNNSLVFTSLMMNTLSQNSNSASICVINLGEGNMVAVSAVDLFKVAPGLSGGLVQGLKGIKNNMVMISSWNLKTNSQNEVVFISLETGNRVSIEDFYGSNENNINTPNTPKVIMGNTNYLEINRFEVNNFNLPTSMISTGSQNKIILLNLAIKSKNYNYVFAISLDSRNLLLVGTFYTTLGGILSSIYDNNIYLFDAFTENHKESLKSIASNTFFVRWCKFKFIETPIAWGENNQNTKFSFDLCTFISIQMLTYLRYFAELRISNSIFQMNDPSGHNTVGCNRLILIGIAHILIENIDINVISNWGDSIYVEGVYQQSYLKNIVFRFEKNLRMNYENLILMRRNKNIELGNLTFMLDTGSIFLGNMINFGDNNNFKLREINITGKGNLSLVKTGIFLNYQNNFFSLVNNTFFNLNFTEYAINLDWFNQDILIDNNKFSFITSALGVLALYSKNLKTKIYNCFFVNLSLYEAGVFFKNENEDTELMNNLFSAIQTKRCIMKLGVLNKGLNITNCTFIDSQIGKFLLNEYPSEVYFFVVDYMNEKLFFESCFVSGINSINGLISFGIKNVDVNIKKSLFSNCITENDMIIFIQSDIGGNYLVNFIENDFLYNKINVWLNSLISLRSFNNEVLIMNNKFCNIDLHLDCCIIKLVRYNVNIKLLQNMFCSINNPAVQVDILNKNVYMNENYFNDTFKAIRIYEANERVLIENCIFRFGLNFHIELTSNNKEVYVTSCWFTKFKGESEGETTINQVIILRESNEIFIRTTLFEDNESDSGTAILSYEFNSFHVSNCKFINHTAYVRGGVVLCYYKNTFSIEDSLIFHSWASERGGGVFYLDKKNYNIFMRNNLIIDSTSSADGGAGFFGNENVNITIEASKFLGVKTNISGAIYINVGNVDLSIKDCEFQRVFCSNDGTLLFLQIGNKNISLTNILMTDSFSSYNLTLAYYYNLNELFINNSTFINCSSTDKNYFFASNEKNSFYAQNLTIVDYWVRALIKVEFSFNQIRLSRLSLIYKNLQVEQEATSNENTNYIEIRKKANEISIELTKFSKLKSFLTFLHALGENSISIENCQFLSFYGLTHLIRMEKEGFADSQFKLRLNYIFMSKNFFFGTLIVIPKGLAEISSLTGSFNFIDSLVNAVSLKILVIDLRLKIKLLNYSSSLMVLTESETIIRRSEFVFSLDPTINKLAGIRAQNSNLTIFNSSFLFGLFKDKIVGGVLIDFSTERRTELLLFNNIFLSNFGEYTGVLTFNGNASLLIRKNYFILNQIIKPKFFGTILFLNKDNNISFLMEDNVIISGFNAYSIFFSHLNYLKDSEIAMIKNKNFYSYKKISNYFSSNIKKVLLFKNFSGDLAIDIFNGSFKIENVKSKIKLSQCYLEVIALDQYDNPIFLENIGNKIETNDVSINFEKSSEYSICLNNITTLNTNMDKGQYIDLNIPVKKFLPFFSSSNDTLQLSVKFIDCDDGEVYDSVEEICVPCQKGFSTVVSSDKTCERCKDSHPFNCYGSSRLTPKPGFARFSTKSQKFMKCPNKKSCLGDKFFAEDPEFYQETKFLNERIEKGLCLEGYTGALCAECDEGYGVTKLNVCATCFSSSYYLTLIGKLAIRVFLIYLSIFTGLSINRSFERDNYIESYVPKMSFFLRSMMNHFQVLVLLYSLPFTLPGNLKETFSIFLVAAAPELGESFSFECFLKHYDIKIPYQYFKIIMMYWFNILTLIFFLSIEYFKEFHKSARGKQNATFKQALKSIISFRTFLLNKGMSLVVLIISITFIDQMKPLLELLACVQIGDESVNISVNRLIAQISIDCNSDQHLWWTLYLTLPSIVLIVILLPIYLSFKLYKKQKENTLYSKEMVSFYGFLFYGYHPSRYYFELLIYLRRLSFLSLQVFFFNYPGSSDFFSSENACLVLLLLTFAFMMLQIGLDPYNRIFFSTVRRCDIYSFTSLIYTCIFALIWMTRGEELSLPEAIILLIMITFANTAFIVYWLRHFLSYVYLDLKKTFLEINMTILSIKNSIRSIKTSDTFKGRANFLRKTTIIALSDDKKGSLVKIQSSKDGRTTAKDPAKVNISSFSNINVAESIRNNPKINYKEEISALKSLIHFQQIEMKKLKEVNEKLLKELKASCQSTSYPVKDNIASANENSVSPETSKAKTEKPKEKKSNSEEGAVTYEIQKKEERSGKGWSLLVIYIKIKNMKREEANKFKGDDIVIKGSEFIQTRFKFIKSTLKNKEENVQAKFFIRLNRSMNEFSYLFTVEFQDSSSFKLKRKLMIEIDLKDFILIKLAKAKPISKSNKVINYENASKDIIRKLLYDQFKFPLLFDIEDIIKGSHGFISFERSDQSPMFCMEFQNKDGEISVQIMFVEDGKSILTEVFYQYISILLKIKKLNNFVLDQVSVV